MTDVKTVKLYFPSQKFRRSDLELQKHLLIEFNRIVGQGGQTFFHYNSMTSSNNGAVHMRDLKTVKLHFPSKILSHSNLMQ